MDFKFRVLRGASLLSTVQHQALNHKPVLARLKTKTIAP